MPQIFHVISHIIVRVRYYPRGSCMEHKMVLHFTTANHCTIRRSKASNFVVFYDMDKLLKRNVEMYTKISRFPCLLGK